MTTPGPTIGTLLHTVASEAPERPFLRCGDSTATYAEMAMLTDRVGAGLAAHGVGKDAKLAILSANRAEFAALYLSCGRAGVIQVPLNAFLKGEFLRYQLEHSTATAIALDHAGFESVAPLLPLLPGLQTIICFDDLTLEHSAGGRTLVSYADLATSAESFRPPTLTEDDVASLLYTSGTTGLPKGCVVPHGYALRFARHWARQMELTADDVQYGLYPLFHAGGQLAAMLSPLIVGCSAVIETEFSAQQLLPRAIEWGATVVAGVGAHALMLLAQPPTDLDHRHRIRLFYGAPLRPDTRADLAARLGITVTAQQYGQTECCPVTYSPYTEESTNPSSCGRPAPDLDVAVVDEDDRPVPAGAIGEIMARARGPHAMFAGYWRDPDATARAFRGGWYHTGDAGLIADDGTLTFVDRKKNVIRRRGENISSVELEAAILGCPGVADVTVFPIASDLVEDEVMATIVLAEGCDATPGDLFAYFKGNVPYFAIPRYVDVVDSLPRNAMNRVMKHVLQERGVTAATWDFNELGLVVGRTERRGGS